MKTDLAGLGEVAVVGRRSQTPPPSSAACPRHSAAQTRASWRARVWKTSPCGWGGIIQPCLLTSCSRHHLLSSLILFFESFFFSFSFFVPSRLEFWRMKERMLRSVRPCDERPRTFRTLAQPGTYCFSARFQRHRVANGGLELELRNMQDARQQACSSAQKHSPSASQTGKTHGKARHGRRLLCFTVCMLLACGAHGTPQCAS